MRALRIFAMTVCGLLSILYGIATYAAIGPPYDEVPQAEVMMLTLAQVLLVAAWGWFLFVALKLDHLGAKVGTAAIAFLFLVASDEAVGYVGDRVQHLASAAFILVAPITMLVTCAWVLKFMRRLAGAPYVIAQGLFWLILMITLLRIAGFSFSWHALIGIGALSTMRRSYFAEVFPRPVKGRK